MNAETDVSQWAYVVPEWAPDARIPLVFAVRHIWTDVVGGSSAVHALLKDPRKHICCMLHSVELSLPRSIIFTMARLAECMGKLQIFNTQHAPFYSAEHGKESKKLEPPTFHGPVARALIRKYASCVAYDEKTDTFSVDEPDQWPLRGIIEDNDPNHQHVLAVFYWLNKEMELATKLFVSKQELDDLFHCALEVTIRLRAISVFGAGYPHYAHYHLHAAWTLVYGNLQGWRFMC
jgi:hypothetical protein